MTAPGDNNLVTMLLRGLAGLCDEIRHLRDDLYNHALVTNGGAFATAFSVSGNRQFAVADMQPQAAAVVHEAFSNDSNVPVVAIVHSEPVTSVVPPAGLVVESTVLMLTVQGAGEATAPRAPVVHNAVGGPVPVIVRPNERLFISCMASAAVTVSWVVVPMRGRGLLFQK